MRALWVWALGAACGAQSLAPAVEAVAAGARFTVGDSIGMTRIVQPKFTPAAFGGSPAEVKWAPDRRHFFIVTSKGNLETDTNACSLLVFDTAVVARSVEKGAAVEGSDGVAVATFVTGSPKGGLHDAKWIGGGRALAFIGRGAEAIGQVYTYDLERRELTRWTSSPADIVRFDISLESRRVVFAVEESGVDEDREQRGYTVTTEEAIYIQRGIRNTVASYYTQSGPGGPAARLPMAPVRTVFGTHDIYMSPDGRWAVTAVPAQRYPASWAGYGFVRAQLAAGQIRLEADGASNAAATTDEAHTPPVGGGGQLVFSNFVGPDDSVVQYLLFDLRHAAVNSLLDAPGFLSGVAAAYYEGQEAAWSPDSSRVLLPSTMLPLTTTSQMPESDRQYAVAVGVASTDRGVVTSILETHPVQPERQSRIDRRSAPSLEVRTVQDMNSAPELEATLRSRRRSRVITDFNPQFRSLQMGHVRTFEWTDRRGRSLSGGLVLPPGYDAGKRYPVVIQLGRFSPADFVVDGIGTFGTTTFAARALAGRDILVVEPATLRPVPDVKGQHEGEMIVELIDDLIDALERDRLAEPGKVGVVGFSRTGMYAQLAAAFAKHPLAAITVADSVAMTPFCYAREYGSPLPSMTQFEEAWQMGAPFWGEGIQRWQQRSDLFHLASIRAAVRYETNGEKVPCYWEAFAILSRMKHPVDMIQIPQGGHLLVTPRMRFTSAEGNVDWQSFWLAGYVDPAPEKRGQYARWQHLRRGR